MKKQIIFYHIGMIVFMVVLVFFRFYDKNTKINRLESANSAIKAQSAVTQKYADAVEHELIQAWMDVCLFKTDADMSDDYDAQYMECECVVANNLDKLAGGVE